MKQFGSRIHSNAFTLIELLIVVAIIAVLAAIAVPNFLEAQTRAKVSRARADHRAISTGLEAYHIDHNTYPLSNQSSRALLVGEVRNGYKPTLERLSTPVAYLTGKASYQDPFKGTKTYQGNNLEEVVPIESYSYWEDSGHFNLYWYVARNSKMDGATAVWDQPAEEKPVWYALESAGPDGAHHNLGSALNLMKTESSAQKAVALKTVYDTTNGTVSRGSIWRVGGTPAGSGVVFYKAAAAAAN